ncbi:hypothetical protein [Gardnerella sp. KA00255]|uniref:hypothetical protein n=1 Tax=Gardnerella sp. KA00255 TaxID=2749073 RepID=UPI003BACBF83
MKRLGKHSIYTSSSHKRWVYIPIVLIVIISWMCMNETHINAFLHDVKSSSAMAEGKELRNANELRNADDLRPSSDLRDFDSRGLRNLHVKNVDFRGENDTKISNKSMFAFAHAYVRLKITIDGFTREFAKNLKTVRVNIPSYNSTNNSRLYRNFLALSEDVEVNYKENPQIKSLPLDALTSYTINLTLKNEGIYDLSKITVKSVSLRYPSRYRIYSNSKNYDSENNADNGIRDNGISGNVVADNNKADNSSLSISNFDNNQSFIRYIVIDNTRPKISVKYEDNNSRDMQYFNTRRIAHVTIQDENFALVKSLEPAMPIAVNSFNNNKVILTASDFTKEDTSKKWHATANYDDGFWCVLYGFVDLSGNKSEILKNSFIVDSKSANAGITNTGSNEKRDSGSRDSDVDSSNSDAIRSDAATDRNRASDVNNDSNNNTRNSNDSKSSSVNVGNSKSAKKEATNENLNKSNKARKDYLVEKSVKTSAKIKRSSNNAANGSSNNAANKRVSQKVNGKVSQKGSQKVSQKVGGKDSLKSAYSRKSDDINKRDSSPKRVEESNASDVSNASDASSASKKQEKDEDSSDKTVQKTKGKSAEKNENDSEVSNTKSNKSVKKNKNVSRSVYRLHPRWKAILKDHNRAMPHDMADAIRLNRSARKSYAKKDSSNRASADSSNKSSTKSKKSSDNSANHDDSEEDSANKDKTSDKDSDSDKGDDGDKDSGSKSDDDKNSKDSKDKNKDDSENQGEISNEHSNKKLMSEDKSFSNNPSKNNNAGLLIAIAVIIVSVSGVCVVGYFVYRHDGKLFGN